MINKAKILSGGNAFGLGLLSGMPSLPARHLHKFILKQV